MKGLKSCIAASIFASSSLYAGGWEDIIKGSEADLTINDDGQSHTTNFYNASLTYTIINNDGIDGNFAGTDTAVVTIISDGKVLTSGSTPLTEEGLKTWAKENSTEIIDAVFNGDPIATLGGQNSGTTTATNVTQTISTLSSKKKQDTSGITSFQSKVLMGSETVDIKDGTKEIDGKAGLVSFADDTDGGNNWGLVVAYRDTSSNDSFSSETKSLSFAPFYKIENPVNESFELPLIINLTTNILYLKSTVFPDGGGYLEYGAGIGTTPSYKVSDSFLLNSNISLQYLKKYIPSSYVPEDAEWVADAINNLKPLRVLSYGAGFQFFILENWDISLDAMQAKHLVTDDIKAGREKATYYVTTTSYKGESWDIGLGYKTVKSVKDYDEDSYLVSLSYNW